MSLRKPLTNDLMFIVYMARHGETEWNRNARYQGRLESSLTEWGVDQASALAAALPEHPVTRVVSSPLERCTQTANPVARIHGLPVETDARLLEIAHGSWEGRLRTDVERDDPKTMRQWRGAPQRVRFPGGESLRDVLVRWEAFAAVFDGNNEAVVVTHDVVVRVAILHATGKPLSMLWEPRVVTLTQECRHDHLRESIVDPEIQAL